MKNYYKVIKSRLITSVIMTNTYTKDNDVNINHLHYGSCICWAQVLRDLGHNVEIHAHVENELLKISINTRW